MNDLAWVLIVLFLSTICHALVTEGLRYLRWKLVIVSGPKALAYLKAEGVLPDG